MHVCVCVDWFFKVNPCRTQVLVFTLTDRLPQRVMPIRTHNPAKCCCASFAYTSYCRFKKKKNQPVSNYKHQGLSNDRSSSFLEEISRSWAWKSCSTYVVFDLGKGHREGGGEPTGSPFVTFYSINLKKKAQWPQIQTGTSSEATTINSLWDVLASAPSSHSCCSVPNQCFYNSIGKYNPAERIVCTSYRIPHDSCQHMS